MGANPLLETSDRDSIPGTAVCPQQFPFHLHLAAHGSGTLDHVVSACSASKSCLLSELAGAVPSPPAWTQDPVGREPGAPSWERFSEDSAGTLLCLRKVPLSGCTLLAGVHLPQATVSCCAEMAHMSSPAEKGHAAVRSGRGRLSLSSEMWLPKLLPRREQ